MEFNNTISRNSSDSLQDTLCGLLNGLPGTGLPMLGDVNNGITQTPGYQPVERYIQYDIDTNNFEADEFSEFRFNPVYTLDMSFNYKKKPFGTRPRIVKEYLYNSLLESDLNIIDDYDEIFFIGCFIRSSQCKENLNSKRLEGYLIQHDHLAFRYEILMHDEKDPHGSLIKAYDHKLFHFVTIKLIVLTECDESSLQNEVRIMKYLGGRDVNNDMNLVHLLDEFTFGNYKCLVFEYLFLNLYQVMSLKKGEPIHLTCIKKIAFNVLTALKALYELDVIHCNLKPENIVLKHPSNNGLKVVDFSSSCFSDEFRFNNIQSRYYRAPEIILGVAYDHSIDMWSLGCILVELLLGTPLFKGETRFDQLSLIMELRGVPPSNVLRVGRYTWEYFNSFEIPLYCNAHRMPDGAIILLGLSPSGIIRGAPGSKQLQTVLGHCESPQFIDFISCCLDTNPVTRLKPAQALKHPWIINN